MDTNTRNQKYNDYLNAKMPKTKAWPTLFHAFWVGGLICCMGEGIKDLMLSLFSDMQVVEASNWSLIIIIALASLLTGIGVYDKIGAYAGAGSIIPISGFSNSITSPALEFKREGLIFGLCAKMFIIAGPVIVSAVFASIVAGVIAIIK